MDPVHNHPLSASNEGSFKNDKDFKNTNKQTLNNSSGTKMRIPVFDLPQIKKKSQQPRKNRQQKSSDFNHSTAYPKRGTFDIPDYQSLLAKSNNLFKKRHHILAKLSSNGIYDEIYEEDEDLINLMEDTLNQPDVLYKETSKAVVQSCQDSYTIQKLIKEKVSTNILSYLFRFLKPLNTLNLKIKWMGIIKRQNYLCMQFQVMMKHLLI